MMKKRNFADNAVKTATLMMILTLVSKLIGFVRELVIAGSFGTSYVVDAYVMAQSIPGVLFGGVLAAIGTAYTPTYSRIRETRGAGRGDRFTSQILTLTAALAAVVFVFGAGFSEQLVTVFAKNFSPEAARLTSFYLKVTFSYAVFSCAVSTLTAYLQYNGRFLSPILGGYIYNAGIITVAVISAKTDARFLAFGMLLGYLLDLLFVYAAARGDGYRYRPGLSLNSDIRQTFRLAVPSFFGASLYSINTFVDKTLASGLSEGSVSALNYGTLLIGLITGLTTTIITTILYPRLAQAINQDDMETGHALVEKSTSAIMAVAIPFCLGGLAFSQEIVQIIYERGSFDAASTALTSGAFSFYILAIPFSGISDLYTRVYYSLRDMKTLIFCSAVGISVNVGMNLLLVGSLEHRGLALATSLAAVANMTALAVSLGRKRPELFAFPARGKLLRITLSAVLSVGTALLVYRLLQQIWLPRVVYLGLAVLSAVPVYLGLLALMKVEEVSLLKKLL